MKLRKKEKKDKFDELDDDLDDDLDLDENQNDAEMDDFDLNDGLNDMNDDFFGDNYQDVPMKKHADLLKELTNFSPYIKESFNNWLGVTWDETQGKYITNPLLKPVMSLQGGAWCSGYLKTYARGNNIITNIDDETYANIMQDHIDAIWLNLGTRDDFGIKSEGDLLRIANELEHATALILKGASDGKYNKLLSSTSTYNYSNSNNGMPMMQNQQMMQPQRKKGLINNLMRKLGVQ